MFDHNMLPSSFQTPTDSITSQKISSFQQQSAQRLYPYSSSEVPPENVNSSQARSFKKQEHTYQQTSFPSHISGSQRAGLTPVESKLAYNVLPPLEPISFNPITTWAQKPSGPVLIPTFNVPVLNSNASENSSERMDQMRKDNFDLYFQNRNLKEQLQKLKGEHESLATNYTRVHQELDTYKKDIDRSKILESINANLKTEITMVFDELRDEKNKVEALERQIEGLKREIVRYEQIREKDKVAYKNLLSQLHNVKSQLDNIRRGPTEIFRTPNQAKLANLREEQTNRIQYLEQLKEELMSVQNSARSKEQSKGQIAILELQKQIAGIKEQNKRRETSRGSKRIRDDQMIKNIKQGHQEELERLKREIHKKEVQAERLEQELSKLGE